MSMIVKGSGDFEPAPPGLHAAVCIDVADRGMVETAYGLKHRLVIVWALAAKMKSGKPYIVQKSYNWALHPKSTLAADLSSWRGRAFSEEEMVKGFDMEILIGKACYVSIQQNVRNGQTYANVVAVVPLPKEVPAPIPDPTYKRRQDREPAAPYGQGPVAKYGTVNPMPQVPEDWDGVLPGEEADGPEIPF